MEYLIEKNRIISKDAEGKIIAAVTFPAIDDKTVNIDHTFVDPSLRGQDIAAELLQKAYAEIKRQNKTARATCSYAQKWFEQNKDCRDIIEP